MNENQEEQLAAKLRQLEEEFADKLQQLKDEFDKENAALRQRLKAAENTIRRAKDPNPVQRPSIKRVLKLVADACMTLQKIANGWLLKLGHLVRRFKRLSDIWKLLIADEWCLSDIFPPPEEGDRTDSDSTSWGVRPRLPHRNPPLAGALAYDATASPIPF